MKNNKGITMISLVITIIVLLIVSSIIIYNGMGQLGIKRVNYLYADIESLSTKVADYYLKNETLPVFDNTYVNNKSELETLFKKNGATTDITNVNDGDEYYVIDLSKLDNLTLNYGDDYKDWTSTSSANDIQNIYIINSVTHQIYFPHGIRLRNEYYFARFPDEKVISPISLEETENDIEIEIIKKSYIKIDSAKEYISAEIIVNSEEEYQTTSLKYAWTDTYNEDIFDTIEFTDFALDSDNKATLLSLPLDKSTGSHYLLIKAIDNNGSFIKGIKDVTKELYAILYSNNSDNTDLELVFNSTGELDDSGRTTLVQTNNIINSHYTVNNKTLWDSNKANIKTVTIEDEIFPKNTSLWFSDCTTLTQIKGIENLDTSNVQDMSAMFSGCSGLTSLDLSGFDTSKVTKFSNMFYRCSGLTNLDVSNFDTSMVDSMNLMFRGCSSLRSLNLSSFNTENTVTMYDMFRECSNLTTLDLSNFNTSRVETMADMFQGCSRLTSLDLSSFNTSKVKTMLSMFNGCSGLTSLDLSSFNTSSVTTMEYMLFGCSKLTSLDLSSFNTSSVTTMKNMFNECKSLKSINLSSFDTSSVTTMTRMFKNCSGLTSLDLSNFDTKNVKGMVEMFQRM